ncbi:MAG: beta-ketoacyl-ACP synthase II [Planctomycetota bacterium]
MNLRRVVVTGMGVVTPLGQTVDEYWKNILAGKSGISQIERFDTTDFTTKIGGEIKKLDWEPFIHKKEFRKLDPFSAYGLLAARQALAHSGLLRDTGDQVYAEITDEARFIDPAKIDPNRIGALIGSGIGGLTEIENQYEILKARGPGRVSPQLIPMIMLNACTGGAAIAFGLKGPNYSTASACSAGSHALALAFRHIKYGDADAMIAGASEATVTRLAYAGFCQARAMSRRNEDPEHASRPFDKDRDGFVMGEGGGVLVFEELEHAKRRGAEIHAEIVGMGATDDAVHITAPSEDGEGARRAMELAIAESGLPKDAFRYINAHGTSTDLNDRMETRAIKDTFGPHAKNLCVSSTKSMIGHLLGASGGVELIATVLSLKHQIVHPTANLENPGEGCDLDYVPGSARKLDVPAALSNSFGFGGHNACIALKAWEG